MFSNVRLSVRPFIRPSVHLSVGPSVHRSFSQPVLPRAWPSVRPSVCPFALPSVRPSVRLSVRPSARCLICSVDSWRTAFFNLYNNFYTQSKLLHVKYSLQKNKTIKIVKYSELICQHCHNLKQVISSSLEIVVADLIIVFMYSDSALNLYVIAAELRHNVQTRS